MTPPRVVAQQSGSAFLVHVGDVQVATGELFEEMYLDSIVKFGGWVEFTGSNEERERIENEVRARL